jgi:hypothetical protein
MRDKFYLHGLSSSVFNTMLLGSVFSVRSVWRLGSSLSVGSVPVACTKLSASQGFCTIASSLSVRIGCLRFGHMLSTTAYFDLGSGLSTRSFSRTGSCLSVHGIAFCMGSVCRMSCIDSLLLSSSLSVRLQASARFAHRMSTSGTLPIGTCLSMRSYSRLGSSLSTKIGSNNMVLGGFKYTPLSVVDSVVIGSSLSVRSGVRVPAYVSSICNVMHLSSSLSVRCKVPVAKAVTVINFLNLSSSFSIRSVCKLGSGGSVIGGLNSASMNEQMSKFCHSVSLSNSLCISSATSLRGGKCNLAASISMTRYANLGSSLSVRGNSHIM